MTPKEESYYAQRQRYGAAQGRDIDGMRPPEEPMMTVYAVTSAMSFLAAVKGRGLRPWLAPFTWHGGSRNAAVQRARRAGELPTGHLVCRRLGAALPYARDVRGQTTLTVALRVRLPALGLVGVRDAMLALEAKGHPLAQHIRRHATDPEAAHQGIRYPAAADWAWYEMPDDEHLRPEAVEELFVVDAETGVWHSVGQWRDGQPLVVAAERLLAGNQLVYDEAGDAILTRTVGAALFESGPLNYLRENGLISVR